MLLYRIPGQEIVRSHGVFLPVKSIHDFLGFVVSDADAERFYTFCPMQHSREVLHPNKIKPHNMDQTSFSQAVIKIKQAIQHLGLVKLVLSRVISKPLEDTTALDLFESLCSEYPNAFVYYFNDCKLGEWIGASPEVLLRRIKDQYFLMSLAGTRPSDEIPPWQDKELVEQRIVTDYLEEILTKMGIAYETNGPYNHAAGPVTHLRTDIWFDSTKDISHDLILEMHPTPAVCGIPPSLAQESIKVLEKHQRELYTGVIGFIDKEQTYCYVNLRCAQIIDGVLHAYAGAGITAESDPEAEWIETENKSNTLLSFLN
jgi:isochorismate synthase